MQEERKEVPNPSVSGGLSPEWRRNRKKAERMKTLNLSHQYVIILETKIIVRSTGGII